MKVLLYNINLFTVFVSHYYMQAFSLGTFISLVISLAANNSIVLPETSALENISVNINILGGNFLQRSVNILLVRIHCSCAWLRLAIKYAPQQLVHTSRSNQMEQETTGKRK